MAGTQVLSEQGYTAIEQLSEGDLVWAHNPETGETALKPIVRTFVNTQDSIWQLSVVGENGDTETFEVTGSHPFYVTDIGWVEVAHLNVGDQLMDADNRPLWVAASFDTGKVTTTYNLEVADIHIYYVGASRVLVHNCGGDVAKTAELAKSVPDKFKCNGTCKEFAGDLQKKMQGAGINGQRLDMETGTSLIFSKKK